MIIIFKLEEFDPKGEGGSLYQAIIDGGGDIKTSTLRAEMSGNT